MLDFMQTPYIKLAKHKNFDSGVFTFNVAGKMSWSERSWQKCRNKTVVNTKIVTQIRRGVNYRDKYVVSVTFMQLLSYMLSHQFFPQPFRSRRFRPTTFPPRRFLHEQFLSRRFQTQRSRARSIRIHDQVVFPPTNVSKQEPENEFSLGLYPTKMLLYSTWNVMMWFIHGR